MSRALSLVLLFMLLVTPVSAQSLTGADTVEALILPEYPRPYQSITIYPKSTLLDLSASSVEILINGAVIYRGSGTEGAVARVGGLGETTRVVVRVTDPGGRVYSKEVVIRPAEVSLVLEPISTVHPFYQGGSLVASEGSVRLVAIADLRNSAGVRLAPSSLVYTWRLADRILTDQSGIGKYVLPAQAPVRYRNADITVTVTSQDNTLVGEAQTRVSAVDPITRIYANDPLLGPNYDVALAGRYTMPDTEATFRAVSYFFAIPPTLVWTVNGKASGGDRDITVRSTGSGAGTAQLKLSADERSHYQSAGTGISVGFGGGGGLGIFGL